MTEALLDVYVRVHNECIAFDILKQGEAPAHVMSDE